MLPNSSPKFNLLSLSFLLDTKTKAGQEASTNAIAPYDFVIEQNDSKLYIDVKSTEGEFSNPIHVSHSELLEIEKRESQYHLYRIYAMSNIKAKLIIIKDLSDFAKEVLSILRTLPDYIKSDGITLLLHNREFAKFGEEITIHRLDKQEFNLPSSPKATL